MYARKLRKDYTPEEYFRLEERSHLKHEFHDGAVHSMVGGTPRYSILTVNIAAELRRFLKGGPCSVFSPDMCLGIRYRSEKGNHEHYLFPDAMVSCDDRDREETRAIWRPKVIVEVLSPSTAQYDRTDKFDLYRRIPSLEDYVLISQEEPRVDVFHRVRDIPPEWLLRTSLPGDRFEVKSLEFDLEVDEIYAD